MTDINGRWFCTVCGADAPDYRPAMGARNRKNLAHRPVGVIALPCGHEQPNGLGYRAPPADPASDSPAWDQECAEFGCHDDQEVGE